MPNIVIALDDIESSVERPVIYDVIRQVMDITQISSKTAIRFYGDEGKAAQKNSTLTKDTVAENSWGFDERVFIEVSEDFETDRMLSTAIKQPENQFIFRDPELKVSIKPAYSSSDVTISVKYRARDKNQAMRWRNEIRARTAMMRSVNMHELSYHYHLPEEYLVLLKEIHTLRENISGYGDTFDDYFARRLTTNASVVSNLSGKQVIWAISERQIRVQGYFDFEGAPEKPDKDGDNDTWTIAFNYKFKYDKPIHCNMVYPIVVHQQILGEGFRPAEKSYSITDQLKSYTLSSKNFSKFETDTAMLSMESNKGLDIPSFDEFAPNSIPSATVRVFTVLNNITEEDKRTLFNLAELGDFNLDADILEFMKKSEYLYMGKTYNSIFCLNLYENEYLKASGSLVVDSSLNVLAAADLSLRKTHRIRLGLVADFSYLKGDALVRLKAFPNAAAKIVLAINSALVDCGSQSDLMKNRLNGHELNTVGLKYGVDGNIDARDNGRYDSLPIGPSKHNDGRDIRMNLVQSLFVAARKVTDYTADVNDQNYGPTT